VPGIPMDIPGPKKKVLVIEDDPDVARMLVTLLGRAGPASRFGVG